MIAAALLAGCWPDLRGPAYEPWDSAAAAQQPNVAHESEGDGVTRTTVDATDGLAWVYVEADDDLAELDGPRPGWDLAFSRQRVQLNGGVSGDGGVEVAILPAARLEDVTAAPADGWVADGADDGDDNQEPEYAFDAWFSYDPDTHVLTPQDLVFVVRTSEARHVAIEVVSYYDDAGSSGWFTLRWKLLP